MLIHIPYTHFFFGRGGEVAEKGRIIVHLLIGGDIEKIGSDLFFYFYIYCPFFSFFFFSFFLSYIFHFHPFPNHCPWFFNESFTVISTILKCLKNLYIKINNFFWFNIYISSGWSTDRSRERFLYGLGHVGHVGGYVGGQLYDNYAPDWQYDTRAILLRSIWTASRHVRRWRAARRMSNFGYEFPPDNFFGRTIIVRQYYDKLPTTSRQIVENFTISKIGPTPQKSYDN